MWPALVISLALVAAPPADSSMADSVPSRLASLESRLAELEAAEQEAAHAEARRQVDLLGDLLDDADRRVSLRRAGFAAGYDGGFSFESADGAFSLTISGQIQARHVYNHQRDGEDGDDERAGFEMRRTKIAFNGHIVDRDWRYKVKGNFADDGRPLRLQSSWIERRLDADWSLRIGQFKAAFDREQNISSKYQSAAERSMLTRRFRVSYTQGVQLEYETDELRIVGAFHDGARESNSAWEERDTEWAATARAEVLLLGDRLKQFRDFAAWPDVEPAIMLGGAFHAERDEFGTSKGGEDEVLRWAADLSIELPGVSLFAGYVGNRVDEKGDDTQNQWGIVGQVGVFVLDDLEVFGRYEYGDAGPRADELSVVTVGFTRYFHGHDAKLTVDVGYGLEPVEDYWATTSAGWREDEPGRDGQLVIRTQFQLLF